MSLALVDARLHLVTRMQVQMDAQLKRIEMRRAKRARTEEEQTSKTNHLIEKLDELNAMPV